MHAVRPLLVSNDAELIDEILRLAAAHGIEVHLCADAEGARGRWQLAPLVIVGADAAIAVAGSGLARRRDVVLVTLAATADDWQHAVALGAEHVVALPDGERWLIDRLADSGEGGSREGAVVALIGCGGGAGATTMAVTMALAAAASSRRVLLIDGDAYAGGIDVVLGLEGHRGTRWSDLLDVHGRLSAHALDQALLQSHGVSVLSWGRSGATEVPVEVVAAVLDVGTRAYDLVLVDLPRRMDAMAELVLARSASVLVVGTNRVRSAAAAARLTSDLKGRCSDVRLILRHEPRGVQESAVLDALDAPGAHRLPFTSGLARRADRGEPPSLRDAYGRACRAVTLGLRASTP